MFAREVVLLQGATDALFQTADAQAASHFLDAGRLPNLGLDQVDFAVLVDELLGNFQLLNVEGVQCTRRCSSLCQRSF